MLDDGLVWAFMVGNLVFVLFVRFAVICGLGIGCLGFSVCFGNWLIIVVSLLFACCLWVLYVITFGFI